MLLGGSPGIGKSTLTSMALGNLQGAGRRTLYVSGEESAAQIKLRAERLPGAALEVPVLAETDLDTVLATLDAERPEVCVIDSVQTLHAADLTGAAGSVGQVREVADRITRLAKARDIAVLLVGHVTKEGALAGPRVLEHLVDAVLQFEGERERTYRTLRALKNRFGSTSEAGVFEMRQGGLVEVQDASARFVGEATRAPGSVVLAAMEGSRPLLVEVQALVSPSELVPPRRIANGIDRNRLALVLAVLGRHAGVSVGSADVFVNVAGGVRVEEPGRRPRGRAGRGERRQGRRGRRRRAARGLLRRDRPDGRAADRRPPGAAARRGGEVRAAPRGRPRGRRPRRERRPPRCARRSAAALAGAPPAPPPRSTLRDRFATPVFGSSTRGPGGLTDGKRGARMYDLMTPRSGEELVELEARQEPRLVKALEMVAPGTAVREGIDNIVHARTGGLIIIGDPDELAFLFSGGIKLDVDYSPALLYQLAKMDGAIALNANATKIPWANVQLMPDPTILTTETGTRHRTAERVSKQTDALVIAVSQRRDVVSLYVDGAKYILEEIPAVLAKANQALATLDKYRSRLDQVSTRLTALEFEGGVTLHDVLTVLQRAELVTRMAVEIERYIVELGTEGRLIEMQLEETMVGVAADKAALLHDYLAEPADDAFAVALDGIARLAHQDLLDFGRLAETLGYDRKVNTLDYPVSPRGFRILGRIPRLPKLVVQNIVREFRGLDEILAATDPELESVDGVGEIRAKDIREGLRRLQEINLVDRYLQT